MELEYPIHGSSNSRPLHHCSVTKVTYEVHRNRSIYGLMDMYGNQYGGKDNDGEVLFDITARTYGMKIINKKCPACGVWVYR